MSMRGDLISKEYQSMKFVKDNEGTEFVCYKEDVKKVKDGQALTEEQKHRCLNSNQILGDSW
jgi:hypothetical protein